MLGATLAAHRQHALATHDGSMGSTAAGQLSVGHTVQTVDICAPLTVQEDPTKPGAQLQEDIPRPLT